MKCTLLLLVVISCVIPITYARQHHLKNNKAINKIPAKTTVTYANISTNIDIGYEIVSKTNESMCIKKPVQENSTGNCDYGCNSCFSICASHGYQNICCWYNSCCCYLKPGPCNIAPACPGNFCY